MKKNVLRLGLAIMLVVAFASCQKFGPMLPEYITVNPNPLEVKAGKVEGTITANLPEKYFAEKGVIEVTPVLKFEGGEVVSESATYQGAKVEGNNQVIQYKPGGTITQNFSFKYDSRMAKSTLWLRFKATLKDKEVQIPEVEIAQGCIATSTLFDAATIAPAFAKDSFVRDTKEVTEADIMFQIQRTNVSANADIKALNAKAAATTKEDRRTVDGIEIISAASPDGGAELNEKLAANREKNTVNYIKKQKNNQAAIDAKYIAQDWEGFQKLVMESSVQDKELILRVLGTYQDAEQREKEIKNLSSAYKELANDILPKLRRSQVILTINIAGKTDAELIELANNKPDSLTIDELMFATTIAPDAASFSKFTASNATLNPTDWRTNNNLAADKFAAADYDASKQAIVISNQNGGHDKAEFNFNNALLAIKAGQIDAAKTFLGKAAGIANFNEASGVVSIAEGFYAKAVSDFANTNSNNAGLAQILAGNLDKAQSVLNNTVKKDAMTYYLLAICSARTANEAAVVSNLTKAVELDSNLGKKIATDIEFSKYMTNTDIIAIAK